MRRVRLSALLIGLIAILALVAAGCGGSDDEGSGSGDTGGTAPSEGKQGGDLTFLAAADVDYLDPGQSYYTFGYQVLYSTNRPLYSFAPGRRGASSPISPTAIRRSPTTRRRSPSRSSRTSSTRRRSTARSSPTTSSTRWSAPSARTCRRATRRSYFGDITGSPDAPTKGVKDIEGITATDDTTLEIKLDRPVGESVAQALVMPITVPVPRDYAEKYDEKSPSEYDQYVAFTGPYMVKNDPTTGKVTGRDPGKRIEMVRNPNWNKDTDYRPAYLDSITIEEGNDDLTVASRRTLSATSPTMCCDSGQPPIPVLSRAIRDNKEQIGRVSGGGTRWIALNTTKKPFDNINIRKAVIAGFDRDALRKTRGGDFIGPIAQGFIPPGIPGFEESGGEEAFKDIDYMANPKGDPAVMKKYLDAAKDDGATPTDGGELLTIATNADPGNQTAQVAQAQLNKMGFKLNYRKVPQDTLYTKFCGVPKSNYVICPNVGWFKDFTDPQSLLEPTFKGDAIKPQGNVNWSLLDNKEINDAMTEASLVEAGPERSQAWADINKMIVEQAVAIPYVWDDNITLWSKDVEGAMNAYFSGPDFSFTTLK